MTISQTARDFFEACETGKGWHACKAFCHESATFACQADALADVKSIAGYADWMKGLLVPTITEGCVMRRPDDARG